MTDSQKIEKKIIDILFDKRAITFSFDLPYVYVNGLKSPIYVDNRLLISYPQEREYVVGELVKLIKSKSWLKDIDYISSSLSFASPFGTLVAGELGLPLILIRDDHKTHGKQNKMEGIISPKKNVLIVEEHVSTAASLLNNVYALRANGDVVKHAVAITDTELDIAKRSLRKNKIELSVLVKGDAIIKEAIKRGLIKGRQKDEVLEWIKNPVKWGTVRGYYGNSN